jgi:hypothetical protein
VAAYQQERRAGRALLDSVVDAGFHDLVPLD